MNRFFLGLRTWLVASHLVVLFLPVIALIGTGALAWDLRMQTRDDLEHQATLLSLHIGDRLSREKKSLDELGLSPLLEKARSSTLAGYRVTNANGIVVASSAGPSREDISDDPEVATALAGMPGMAIKARDRVSSRDLSTKSRHASVRVFVAARTTRASGLRDGVW